MKDGFLYVVSKLEVYQELQTKNFYPNLYTNVQTFIINRKIIYLEKFGKIFNLSILRKEGSNTFDQLLIY